MSDSHIFLSKDEPTNGCVVVRFFKANDDSSEKQKEIAKLLYDSLKKALLQLHHNAPHFKLDPVMYPMNSRLAYVTGLGFDGPAITVDGLRVRPCNNTWHNVLYHEDSVAAGIFRLLRWPEQFVNEQLRELKCDTLTYPEAMAPEESVVVVEKEPTTPPPSYNSLILLERFEGFSHDTQTMLSLPPGEVLHFKRQNKFFLLVYVPRVHQHIWIARKGEGSLWRQYTDEEEHSRAQLREMCKNYLKSVNGYMKTNRDLKRKLLNQEIHAAKDKRDLKATKKKLKKMMKRLQQMLV